MPVGLRIARFIRFYGMETYRNPLWPTSDHVIPFKLFALFEGAVANVGAAEHIAHAQAVAHGYAVAMAGESSRVKEETRRLARLAFPTVTIGEDDA